jgi:hypothetical protein
MTRIINVHPILIFLESYLRRQRIPKDAPRIEKENHLLALQCVAVLRAMCSERRLMPGGNCKTPAMGRAEVRRILESILHGCWTPTMGRGEGRRI